MNENIITHNENAVPVDARKGEGVLVGEVILVVGTSSKHNKRDGD